MANYKNHFNGTDDELMELIDKETWLTANECLEKGFCTEIKKLAEPKQDSTQETLNKGIKLMQNFANLKIKEK